MSKVLVVGGANGIGCGIAKSLVEDSNITKVFVADIVPPTIQSSKIEFIRTNLAVDSFEVNDDLNDIDALYISAGIGRVAPFEMLDEAEIKLVLKINAESVICIIKKYYPLLMSNKNFNVAIMCSVAGRINSPLFSVYSASKAALSKFIQSINVELAMHGSTNRILEVSPGKIDGTSFYGGTTNISAMETLAKEVLTRAAQKQMLYIPQYDEIYKGVLERNNYDEFEFGVSSYQYKTARIEQSAKYKIGYLSGTFDMFHVGHLNLIRCAKLRCDYLIVGVHQDATHKGKNTVMSFEDRVAIVGACKYVDRVVTSCKEDSDAWELYKYNYLFVGSDYKNTERFNRYEKFFADKENVQVVYFPYTDSVSSTMLRTKLGK